MEVKDLIQEDLTDEQKKDLELAENKEKYKAIQKYVVSKDYKKLLDYGNKKGEDILLEIQQELETREKPELIYSQVDDLVAYGKYLADIMGQIDDSDGGKILKGEMFEEIKRINDNIYIKVDTERFFDAPIISKLDAIKTRRNLYMTLDTKLATIQNKFAETKEEKQTLHPYED